MGLSKPVHKMITSVRSSSNCDSKLFLNRARVGFSLVMIYFLSSTQLCLPGSPAILGPSPWGVQSLLLGTRQVRGEREPMFDQPLSGASLFLQPRALLLAPGQHTDTPSSLPGTTTLEGSFLDYLCSICFSGFYPWLCIRTNTQGVSSFVCFNIIPEQLNQNF